MGQRPETFNMKIQGGMLESLGVNMYTSLAKSLVEFVANAYDSDAKSVTIFIPYDKIQSAKEKINKEKINKFTILNTVLENNLNITIVDDGHGMNPVDIQNKFLPINRNRRANIENGKEEHNLSENRERRVMGRKGLGKLAGFGAAEQITVTTKRKGENFSTTFTLDYQELSQEENIANKKITAEYKDGHIDDHYTKVTLSRLKYGSVKSSIDMIKKTILKSFFGINNRNFSIYIQDPDSKITKSEPLRETKYPYEFYYPNDNGDFAIDTVKILITSDIKFDIEFQYIVKFRYRKGDDLEIDKQGLAGSLPTEQRGARIYCNNRLAMGPSLLGLHTGVTNYLAHSYMECIVIADELDQEFSDMINTNRTELKQNEITDAFAERITSHMKKALSRNGMRRKKKIDKILIDNKIITPYEDILNKIEPKQKEAFMLMLRKFYELKEINEPTEINKKSLRNFISHIPNLFNAPEILNRKSWIPSDVNNFVPDGVHRARDMFRELSQPSLLDITKAKNAAAVLTRTFIETSIKYYLKKNDTKITYDDRTALRTRMKEAICTMKNKRCSQNIIDQGEKLLFDNSRIGGLETMNEWVHSDVFSPYIDDIITSWNNYKDFIIECWRK